VCAFDPQQKDFWTFEDIHQDFTSWSPLYKQVHVWSQAAVMSRSIKDFTGWHAGLCVKTAHQSAPAQMNNVSMCQQRPPQFLTVKQDDVQLE
jgi:hypothetical protein